MSTVSSSHALNTLSTDIVSPKSTPLEMASPSNPTLPLDVLTNEARAISINTSSDNLDTLATIAENRLSPSSEQQSQDTNSMSDSTEKAIAIKRPSSPSDAILIKRTAVPTLRLDTGNHEINRLEQHLQTNSQYLSAPLDRHYQTLLQNKSHKRSASAPDIPAMSEFEPKAIGPQAEPTPPNSYHPDNASPTSPLNYDAPDTPPTANEAEPQSVVCMYIPNCDTGSQPRKAISHIFGRNKMCTRLIPQHVWVHYCRKHYQRSRYRNPKEYAKLQCDLVQQQIRRVHEWSSNNMKNGLPGTVQDWGLAVRKREQKRLDDLGGAKRKRSAAAFDQNESDDGGDGDGRANSVPATAVPDWLLALCGKGYNTHSILEIFNRLHAEILADVMPCFPDIEILPNIVVDQEEPKSPKGYAKRTAAAAGHKRSQSLGVGAKSDYYSPSRRSSQPVAWGAEGNPAQKRRRPNEIEEAQAAAFGGRRIQLTHRPVFPNIDEHQLGDEFQAENHMREQYAFSPGGYQAPLPAPTPQRLGGQMLAAHLETGHAHGARRPTHSRSQSDMGSLNRGRMMYSTSPSYGVAPSSAHPTGMNTPLRSFQYPSQSFPGQYGYSSPQQRPEHLQTPQPQHHEMRSAKALPSLGHMRHQSTPMGNFQMQSMREGAPTSFTQPRPGSQNAILGSHIPYASHHTNAIGNQNTHTSHNNTLPPVAHLQDPAHARNTFPPRH